MTDHLQYQLVARLRVLRTRAGHSGRALARELGWQPSKVSRIETGQQPPTHADVKAWASVVADAATAEELIELLEASETAHATFQWKTRHGQRALQDDYTALIAQATVLTTFSTVYVPMLLQTPTYARRVFKESVVLHGSAAADVEEAVVERIGRQSVLFGEGKQFNLLLAEPVLRWWLIPPQAMREQLARIAATIALPSVRLGVLPFGRELAAAPQNSVDILHLPEGPRALVETMVGETRHEGEQAEAYVRAVDRLWADAVEGEAVRPLLDAAARVLPAG